METVEITQDVLNNLVGSGIVAGVGFGLVACMMGYGVRRIFTLAVSAWK